MVVARALLLGVRVNYDQGVDAVQQKILEVGVFPVPYGPEPGVKSALAFLGGSRLELRRNLSLEVASLQDTTLKWEGNLLPQTVSRRREAKGTFYQSQPSARAS